MKNDDEQSSLMVAVIGIIPVIWFALLVAPYLSSGLMGILDGVPEAMNLPFSIQLCGDSVKTVLIFVCPAWANSNGCKSRTCPDSGKCIAEQQGCLS